MRALVLSEVFRRMLATSVIVECMVRLALSAGLLK